MEEMVNNSMVYNIDLHLETQKDRKANQNISRNNKHVQFLTTDVEDLDDRILALDIKLNSFLKSDYENLKTLYCDLKDKVEELEQFKSLLLNQIDTLNEQFKMDIIGKFNDLEVVDSFKKIIYDSIG